MTNGHFVKQHFVALGFRKMPAIFVVLSGQGSKVRGAQRALVPAFLKNYGIMSLTNNGVRNDPERHG
jgi:hypothetical protein